MESTVYDSFDYKHADEAALSLDEALKKAAALRANDKSHFHRIVPTDSNMNGFRVESVSREQAYADIFVRANARISRFLGRYRAGAK
jgi:hypothetical protein